MNLPNGNSYAVVTSSMSTFSTERPTQPPDFLSWIWDSSPHIPVTSAHAADEYWEKHILRSERLYITPRAAAFW